MGRNREDVLLQADSGQVLGPDESVTLLVKSFSLMTGSILTIRIVKRKSEGELTGVVNHLQLWGICPRFTSDICQAVIFRDLGLFLAMANKCLELRYFLRVWKESCHKGDPEVGRGQPYRFEVLPSCSSAPCAEQNSGNDQGTEDALCDLMMHIYKELNLKKIILIVSLDIEGAFDKAWWPALKTQLPAQNCPVNLHSMVRATFGTERWSLELGELCVYVQVFADDVVLTFSGQWASSVEEDSNPALTHVYGWGVSLVGEVRLLGLIIDRKLTFTPHVAKSLQFCALSALGHWHWRRGSLTCEKCLMSLSAASPSKHGEYAAQSPSSQLILSRLLPMDIRVKEAACLYELKCGKDTFLDRQLEKFVYFGDFPHSCKFPRSGTRMSRTWTPKPWTVSP
ncbi:hypothetical protein EVAR_42639_1 [Eumeta japonica]|uniref:Reverse transcriptase domain-containing protein n=1 Tax=Eumeta variegata TaxID=151549 RepID=A0A4C1WX39_EUMVA|nr:hypothetical protein EVAR_42639_1 [Eumeta japonica]